MSTAHGNRLTRIGNGTNPGYGLYRCTCGKEKEFIDRNVKCGNTKSCECLFKELLAAQNKRLKTKHGMAGTPTYQAWQSAKQRCHTKKHRLYKNYGARGVRMCVSLQESFSLFLELVGVKPEGKDTIDRTDNEGGYWCGRSDCPECGPDKRPMNLRWVTWEESGNNRRTNRPITYKGKTQNLAQWAKEYKLPRGVLRERLESGWSVEDALNTHIRPYATRPENLEFPEW